MLGLLLFVKLPPQLYALFVRAKPLRACLFMFARSSSIFDESLIMQRALCMQLLLTCQQWQTGNCSEHM